MELENIKWQLDQVISELDSIANGVNTEFSGIGNELCAQAIWRVADQYRAARRRLNNIDYTRVAQGYEQN